MIAIIKDENNKEYVSQVFAIKWKGWDTEVIIFNKDFTYIKKLKMWQPRRQVFIIDYEKFDCKNGGWEGLALVVQDKDLIKNLKKNKVISIEDYPQFKEYSNKIELPEWFEIKSQKDCDSLMGVSFGGFHDSQPVRAEQNDKELEIEFDTTWDCHITMKFIDIIDMDIINRIGLIYDSKMEIKDDIIIWTITGSQEGWIDGCDWDKNIETDPYIKCKKLLWKIEPSHR